MKKTLLLPLLCLSVATVTGCKKNINDYRAVPFTNLAGNFAATSGILNVYTYDDSDVPYLELKNFIAALKGYFIPNIFKHEVQNNNYYLTYTIPSYGDQVLKFDVDTQIITVNSLSFFDNCIQYEETSNSAYNSGLSIYDYEIITAESAIEFELAPYHLDIKLKNNKLYLPLFLANILFCSSNYYNLYYTYENFYGVYFHGDDDAATYSKLRSSTRAGSTVSNSMKLAIYDSLAFSYDYFYGLRDYKNPNFNALKTAITASSSTATKIRDAIAAFIYKELDELHSSYAFGGIYNTTANANYPLSSVSQLGPTAQSWYTNYYAVRNIRTQTNIDPLRFSGNTAFLVLNSFVTNTPDTPGEDSLQYMLEQMENIENHSSNIENVVLDLSYNTGGNLGALLRVMGVITDIPLPYSSKNTLSGEKTTAYYEVNIDSNKDKSNDSFDQYNWYVLSSGVTYSAANYAVSIAKQTGSATVLGQKSGGGACSIVPLILADGTAMIFSSNNVLSDPTLSFASVEEGVEVDYPIDLSNLYNTTYITNFINNL